MKSISWKKGKILMILLLIVSSITIAGCSGGVKGKESDGDTIRDTLTVVIGGDIANVDPHNSEWYSHYQVTRQMYETIVFRNKDSELVPWLAESWEYEDDETIIFKIRKGVKFHNGDELKASDVLFTYKRMKNDNTTGLLQINEIDFDRSAVIDEYTLKVVTKGPFALQIAMLEHPMCGIISEKAYNESGGDFSKAPIGTGPFKFVDYHAGDSVKLERFDDYWNNEAKPQVKYVNFRIIDDSSSRAIEAEAGGADIIYDINAKDVDRLHANKNINMMSANGANTNYITFNTAKKELSDIRVRKAFWYGVDIPTAIKVAYGNFGKVADGVISPGIEGKHPDMSKFFVKRDVEKAKELLAEAGYPNGLTLKINCENTNQMRMDFCETLQAQLAEVGINLELDFMEVNAWLQHLQTGGADTTIYGQTASTGEAGRALMRWLNDGAEYYIASWENQEYFDVIEKAVKTIDTNERNKLYYRAQELLMENFIVLPTWHKEINAALKPEVKGFYLTPSYEQHYLQFVYFE